MSSAITTGGFNTAIGYSAGNNITTGTSNTLIGVDAGNGIGGGTQNICIGRAANLSSGAASNELVLGSSTYYVATNGGPTTYFATATAGAVALPAAALGFIRIYLNGTNVKLAVYGN